MSTANSPTIRAGMVGLGMIFDDTYRPVFEQLRRDGLYRHDFGLVAVELAAVASRTGIRTEKLRQSAGNRLGPFTSELPAANLATVVVVLPLVATIGGFVFAGREPPAIARQPLQ